jgi:hypothetical protein
LSNCYVQVFANHVYLIELTMLNNSSQDPMLQTNEFFQAFVQEHSIRISSRFQKLCFKLAEGESQNLLIISKINIIIQYRPVKIKTVMC